MPSMTFRFTTECEMTLEGDSYEDMYLRFKDFMHGNTEVQKQVRLHVFPPESDQMFFHLDDDDQLHEIPCFKGGFGDDIVNHCEGHPLKPAPMFSQGMLSRNVKAYPEYYW